MDGLTYYLERLCYYSQFINEPFIKKIRGFGPIEFYHETKESLEKMYNFYLDAMIWYIETEKCRTCKLKKKKK